VFYLLIRLVVFSGSPDAGTGSLDECAERHDAQRAAPVADIAVVAEEAPGQGPGQHIPGHRGGGEPAGGRPGQPVRPGCHRRAGHNRDRDDPEDLNPASRSGPRHARQVGDVDYRQRGQRGHGRGTRDHIGVCAGL